MNCTEEQDVKEQHDSPSEEDAEQIGDSSVKENQPFREFSKDVKKFMEEIRVKVSEGHAPTASQLKMLTTSTLEQMLRLNNRPSYNQTKPELATMIVDYIKNGCPPICPKCNRASLRFSNGRKKFGKKYFWCPGSTNNGKHFYGCNFKAPREKIERIPWKYP